MKFNFVLSNDFFVINILHCQSNFLDHYVEKKGKCLEKKILFSPGCHY